MKKELFFLRCLKIFSALAGVTLISTSGLVKAGAESIYDLTYQSSHRRRSLAEIQEKKQDLTPKKKYVQQKKVQKKLAKYPRAKKKPLCLVWQDRPAVVSNRIFEEPKKQPVFVEKNNEMRTQAAVQASKPNSPRPSLFASLLVSPWDRETLGQRDMSLEPLPERANFQEQILASREASAGGFGGVGGGCGCH